MSDSYELGGRRILLTGATGAIGSAIANTLAVAGAHLVLVARTAADLERLARDLPSGPHEILALDVADEQAWQHAVERIAPDGTLDGLVAAAGIIGPIGTLGDWPMSSLRAAFDTNVVGTLLAIEHSLGPLRKARGSVVTLSGGGATTPFPRFDAYAASKAAIVRLTENLAVTFGGDGIRFNAIAPGFIVSQMHDDELAGGPELVGAEYYARSLRAQQEGGDSPELAAALCRFLLSDSSRGITGKLLSARWDPWQDLEFQQRLRDEADFATIRRIDGQMFTAIPKQ